jgi:hypothetical protein
MGFQTSLVQVVPAGALYAKEIFELSPEITVEGCQEQVKSLTLAGQSPEMPSEEEEPLEEDEGSPSGGGGSSMFEVHEKTRAAQSTAARDIEMTCFIIASWKERYLYSLL